MYRANPLRNAAILCLLLTLPTLAPAADSTAEIDWHDNLAGATKVAREKGLPIVVDVWAIWCAPCREMDQTTFRDAAVIELAQRIVPLKIDADVRASFIERYQIDAYPTLLFLDQDGGELSRVRGAVTAIALTELGSKVELRYSEYMVAREGLEEADIELTTSYLGDIGSREAAVVHLNRAIKRLRKKQPERVESLELQLGQAQLEAGAARAAAKTFTRLLEKTQTAAIAGEALSGLVRAERARGRDQDADAALARLRAEHPELAAEFDAP